MGKGRKGGWGERRREKVRWRGGEGRIVGRLCIGIVAICFFLKTYYLTLFQYIFPFNFLPFRHNIFFWSGDDDYCESHDDREELGGVVMWDSRMPC